MTLPQATTLFRNLIVLLGLLFSAAFIVLAAWVSHQAEIEAMERLAHSYGKAVAGFRAYYTENVAGRVSGVVELRPDYRDRPHAIPLPATLTLEVAERLALTDGDVVLALVSDYPFPWRAGRRLDDGERAAIDALRAAPDQPLTWTERRDGRLLLRHATAVRMEQGCVDCHNARADSPKTDWRVGDVRAAQVVSLPARGGGVLGDPHLAGLAAFVLASFGVALAALFVMDGRVRRALSLAAERSQAHADALKVLEERQFAYDQHAIVSIADRAGRITYANEKFRSISGYTLDELLGRNHRIIKSDVHEPAFYREMWRAISSGRVWSGELCNRAKDGGLYWVAATIVPVLGADGRPEQYISIRTDITRRKQVEHGLARQQAFLQSLTDALGEGVYAVDADGLCTFVNPEGERLLGWRRDELRGRRLHDVVHTHHPDGRPMAAADCPLYLAMRRGAAYRTDAEEFRRRDGGAISVSLAAMPLFEDGAVVGQVVAFADITDLKRQRSELEQARDAAEAANRSKSEFLAVMSHEIRTPMNGVIGMTGLLLDSRLDDEQRHFALTIRDSAESLLAIINDILDFSKIEAGRMDFESADFDVMTLVESVVEILAPRAIAKGVELASYIEPDARLVVNGDPGRVRQILMNLAGNAVKFTDQGSVSVVVGHAAGRLRFEVADTGIGIAAEDQACLFAMFSQVDSSATRRHGGAGLGLAISKRLTDMMGGAIGCQSALGEGSLFWFELPVAVVRAAAAATPSLGGKRLLVVDDTAANRALLAKRLTVAGAIVETADDAKAGLAALLTAAAGRGFDAAVLDDAMPGVSGRDLAVEVRHKPALDGLRLVLASSTGMRSPADGAEPSPFDAVVLKPIRESVLIATLSRLLGGDVADEARADPAETDERREVRPLRLLVAEDNPVNQQVATGLLRRMGHAVDVATDGLEAVQAAQARPYDLIFMDVRMPMMDGFSATRRIRDLDGPAARTPIIAMTANAMVGDEAACLAAGMDDYVPKPINAERLAAALAKWGARLESVSSAPAAAADAISVETVRAADQEEARVEEEAARRPVCDQAVLADLVDALGAEDVAAICLNFFIDAGRRAETIRGRLAAGDGAAATNDAHAVKGAADSLGFMRVQATAAQLEADLRQGPGAVAPMLADLLISRLAEAQAAFRDLGDLGGLGGGD